MITEDYKVDVEELAQIYSNQKCIPTQLNQHKKFEIRALAKAYLQMRDALALIDRLNNGG